MSTSMGRELRKVKPGWKHPIVNGRYVPMHDQSWDEASQELESFRQAWESGGEGLDDWEREACQKGEPVEDYEPYLGDPEEYRPHWSDEERTSFQYYETVSEGTPMSPVFDTIEDLAVWLANNEGGTVARWTEHLRNGGWSPSGIASIGEGFMSSTEAITKGVIR